MVNRLGCVFMLVLAACGEGADSPESTGPSSSGATAKRLGIETFVIDESATTLLVEGLGPDGEVVGRIEVSHGPIELEMEPERGVVTGRRMIVDVRGRRITHESEGLARLQLPMYGVSPDARALLLDTQVSAALSRWDIAFDRRYAEVDHELIQGAERAHGCAQVNNSYPLPFVQLGSWYGGCASSSSAIVYEPESGQYMDGRCCTATSNAATRLCDGQPLSEGPCGVYGLGGCAVCWLQSYAGGTCTVYESVPPPGYGLMPIGAIDFCY